MSQVVVVVPAEEDLKIESNGCVCTLLGCGKLFQTSSQLQMHLVKHHEGKQLGLRIGTTVYFCPVENCDRSVRGGKSFPRLGQLKQHYQRIHGVKGYTCQKCGKLFSLKDAHQRHVLECGKEFTCESCKETFKTRNALYKHARRKEHVLPEGSKPRGKKRVSSMDAPVHPPPSLVIRHVVRLPNLASASTQTDHELDASSARGVVSKTNIPSLSPHFVEGSNLHSTLLALDLSTQTEPSATDHSFDFSDLATQTDFSGFFDFGTQTAHHCTSSQSCQTTVSATASSQSSQTGAAREACASSCSIPGFPGYAQVNTLSSLELVEFGTQTMSKDSRLATQTSPDEFGTQTMSCEDSELLGMATQTSPGDYLEFGTQTKSAEDSGLFGMASQTSPGDFLEFGTRTMSAEDSESLGIATQTPSLGDFLDFGTQTNPGLATQTSPNDFFEFGTQTMSAEDPESLGMATQTSSPEEFGTQTMSVDGSGLLELATQTSPGDFLEFGTQTMSCEDSELLGMATQTSPGGFYAHLESLRSRTDFGTQTIEDLFREDVGRYLSSVEMGEGTESGGATAL